MKDYRYKHLMKLLDAEELRLQVSHPYCGSVESPHSTGLFIHEKMDIDGLSQEQLQYVHTMLHLFYSKRSGKGLSKKGIEQLHLRVAKNIGDHKKFDRLDENGLYTN